MCLYSFDAVPTPSSLTLISNSGSPDNDNVVVDSDIILTCTLVLNSALVASDRALLMVDVQLSRDGTPFSNPILSSMAGTTFMYRTQLNPFRRNDSGNYSCNATIRPQSSSTYLTGNEMLVSENRVTTGEIIPETL